MNNLPQQTHGNGRTDISDDIEKDINIDVQITGNTGCTIEHNSQISINYYNLEAHEQCENLGPPGRGLRPYLVHLPGAYVVRLEALRAKKGCNRNELAKMAYQMLLKGAGMGLPAQRARNGRTAGR